MAVPVRPSAGLGPRRSVYREFASSVPGVACAWYGRPGWERNLRVLPDGCVDVVWNGQELTVMVAVDEPVRVRLRPAGQTVGLRLRCGAAGSLLGYSIAELPVGGVPLRELWGPSTVEERLAESADFLAARSILESLFVDREADGLPAGAVSAGARVPEVAAQLGISERGLRRRFAFEVGCSPKQLHRVLRFQRFLARLPRVACGRTSLADVAFETGYADQSHLGRECRALAGSSPAGLVRTWAGRNVPDNRPTTGHRARHDVSHHHRRPQ
ncbi:AraC family transcriptional regulator [Amycolatopsis acidicola]|uniref:AraC family transcriptional regulator n=1 Tax=Amycolatopsis acidicola TaxID=2596893 RepID=A0A5N0V4S2_9PSEU|nr:helix-turn-helix domain-containing protein [Amycolatopsis acidicola]KAA9161386.1 AraC family transcriptional regulator [Amycolatopsis acidicola]